MRRALAAYAPSVLVFVNTLPKVAVAPLFLLWLGYGIVPNMLIGALIGFFPVVINTAVGLSQVDENMLDLGRVFNASKWKVFAKIRVPSASPYILSALEVTATAAVVGAVVGEFVAAQKGLGYLLMGLELMKTERYARHGIGWIDDKKMCQSVDLVNTYMGVPTKVDCKTVFTLEFLPKVELPKTMR